MRNNGFQKAYAIRGGIDGWKAQGGILAPWKNNMRFLELTLGTPQHNIALDEALLLQAEKGNSGESLRIWEMDSPAVILGAGCKAQVDVNLEACAKDGIMVLRRSSGGGTVLLGKGCLLFTLILSLEQRPDLATIRGSYQSIMTKMIEALKLPNSSHDGISDLTLGTRKFSGNAQQRKSNFILHHGSILYDFDLENIPRYLHHPPLEPEYRSKRPHEDFVCNIPLSKEEIVSRLQSTWDGREKPGIYPVDETEKLVAEKYSLDSWTLRR